MEIATFNIKIQGLDFSKTGNGFVAGTLNIDDDRNIFICIKSASTPALCSQLHTFCEESDFSNFGSLIECENGHCNYENKDVVIDFSKSHFITYKTINNTVFLFYIDKVAISYSAKNEENKASFLLNRAGFEIIKGYYGISMSIEDDFRIGKRKKDYCFPVKSSKFYPLFDYAYKDHVDNDEITIKKVPRINADSFTEEDDVLLHFDCLMQLMRIYHNVPVDYLRGEIDYEDKTIRVYKIPNPLQNNKVDALNYTFEDNKDFEDFISNVNTESLINHLDAVKIVIESKLTSKLLNGKTKFIVLYNALENLMSMKYKQSGLTDNKDKFSNIEEIQKQFKRLLTTILPFVKNEEQDDFKTKLSNACPIYKPAKSVYNTLLVSADLDIPEINKLVKKYSNNKYKHIIDLRNDITHGKMEFESVDFDKMNHLLSLTTLLILFSVIGFTNFSLAKFNDSIIHKNIGV